MRTRTEWIAKVLRKLKDPSTGRRLADLDIVDDLEVTPEEVTLWVSPSTQGRVVKVALHALERFAEGRKVSIKLAWEPRKGP